MIRTVGSNKSEKENSEYGKISGIYENKLTGHFKNGSSSDLVFIATLNTGTFAGSPNEGKSSNFLFNGRFSYFYKKNKNIGGDLSVIFLKKAYSINDPQNTYTYQNQTFTDLLVNSQLGTFNTGNKFVIFMNLGFGIHTEYNHSYTDATYSFNDSAYIYSATPSSFNVYPMLQLGGGFMIRPSKNFAFNFEADIKMYSFDYIIIPKKAFFPLQLGLSYFFTG